MPILPTIFPIRQKGLPPIAALFVLLALSAACAAKSHAAEKTIGFACKTGQQATDWDTIARCGGTTFARSAYAFGAATDGCDASHKGQVQWTGSSLQFCNGTAWTSVGSAYLGSSLSVTNPSRSVAETNTGLYAPSTGTLGLVTAGIERMRITSGGNVGIGVASPYEKLGISGAIQISSTSSTCDAAHAGVIQWNGSNFLGCNGSAWKTLSGCAAGQCTKSDGTCGTIAIMRRIPEDGWYDSGYWTYPLNSWITVVTTAGSYSFHMDIIMNCI